MRGAGQRRRLLGFVVSAAALACSLPAAASADTFTVDTKADNGFFSSDQMMGDGFCAAADGTCTLRAALEEAEAHAGKDRIEFAPTVTGTLLMDPSFPAPIQLRADLTIQGPGADQLAISATGSNHSLLQVSSGAVDVHALTIVGGGAGQGGGISVAGGALTVEDSKFQGGGASSFTLGGGIHMGSGTLNVRRSTFSGNFAQYGGGIAVTGGNATIEDSTISGNTANAGGGIDVGGTATVSIVNTTITGNSADNTTACVGCAGGGVLSFVNAGALTIKSSTIDLNTAPTASAAFHYGANIEGGATLTSTIVADPLGAAPNCNDGLLSRTVSSQGHNLESANSCGFNPATDQIGVDPKLGNLQNNGGPTSTQSLPYASPAIDGGISPSGVTKDQRGFGRSVDFAAKANGPAGDGDGADVGAYELADTPPTASSFSATVTEDGGQTAIDVLAHVTDPEGNPTITAVTSSTNGTVRITGSGSGVTYEPAPNYCNDGPGGTLDTFNYALNGGSHATVSVKVHCIDDPPTAADDATVVTEDATAAPVDVLANDGDSDGGPKQVASAADGTRGTVAVTPSGAGVTYTPAANYCGPDSFEYHLNGGDAGTVTVTVTCVDDSPVAVGDTVSTSEDAAAVPIAVLANDTDVDGGPKQIASKTDGAHGSVSPTAGGSGLAYTPIADYCGADSFTYTLNGGSSASVQITVSCLDDPPVAADDAAATTQGSASPIRVLANDRDVDGDAIRVTAVAAPGHGTLEIAGDAASVIYTPDPAYCNTDPGQALDTFTYTINGGSTATVTLTVACVHELGKPDDTTPADTEAPETTLSAHPKSRTTSHVASFEFRASEPAQFLCRLDAKPWASCESPKRYSRLSLGRHKLAVAAADASGNLDLTPATFRWRIVAPAPPPTP